MSEFELKVELEGELTEEDLTQVSEAIVAIIGESFPPPTVLFPRVTSGDDDGDDDQSS